MYVNEPHERTTRYCTLLCVIVCCSVLQCVAVCCSIPYCQYVDQQSQQHPPPHQRVAACCSVLQCVAVCCSVLLCVTVCCSVLQRVAACCSLPYCQYVDRQSQQHPPPHQCVAACCSVLQCVAVCCSVLQRVAVCCIVLQHTLLPIRGSAVTTTPSSTSNPPILIGLRAIRKPPPCTQLINSHYTQHTATHCNTMQHTAT